MRETGARTVQICCLIFAAAFFLSACGGNTVSDKSAYGSTVSEGAVSGSAVSGSAVSESAVRGESAVSKGAVRGESAVSGDAIQADAALAMAEANADILRGIPNRQAVQLCAMVLERRIWIKNGMDMENDEELKEYLGFANYGSGLYYAVTDLDQNGELEILTSNMEGTGRFCYNRICGYDSRTASIQELNYGGDKEEGDIGSYDIGGVEKTAVYVEQDGTYHYAFTDFVRAGSENFAKFCGVLTLKDGVVTEGVCGGSETNDGKTDYYVGDRKVGETDYEEQLEKELRGVNKEGVAYFGWKKGRGGLVEMDDVKLLKKLVDSWWAFRVTIIAL